MPRRLRQFEPLRGWLDATDPGSVRRRQGGRAALAALSTWLTLRTLAELITHHQQPAATLYGVVACFIGALVIADPTRRDRFVTILLCVAATVSAAAVAAAVHDAPGLGYGLLLVLIFTSFAARRYGLRPGEIALVATFALYFATVSGVGSEDLDWYLVAAVIGFTWLAIWQFVLLAYDPAASLAAAGRVFYHSGADVVGEVQRRLDMVSDRSTARPDTRRLEHRLHQVRMSRRVIESQFPAVLAPTGWTADRLDRLQLELYAAQQGLALMVEAVEDPARLSAIPPNLAGSLSRTLHTLRTALNSVAAPSTMQQLMAEATRLRRRRAHRRCPRLGATTAPRHSGSSPRSVSVREFAAPPSQ